MEMHVEMEIETLVKLWDTMCNWNAFQPTVPIINFRPYWLLLKSKWKLADKNHPDTWMYSYEVKPHWLLIKSKWTL
jgi:hypothetical protein